MANLMPTGAIETFTGANGATPNSTNITSPTTNEGSGGGLTIQGNQMRMRTGTTAFNRISTRINRANLADGEMVVDWVAPTWGTMFPGIYARAGSSLNGDGGYYFLPSGTDMVMGKWVPAFSGTDLATVSYTFTAGQIYRTRIAIFGSRIRARTWLASNTEPTGTWDIDFTDSGTQPTTGTWGFTNSSGSAGSKDWFIDNVNLTDTITPSAQTINPTGSITATGTLNKRTSKNFTGSVTSTGALVKSTLKRFASSITATGALTKVRVVARTFTGSITATGVLSKRTSKILAGSVTSTGALRKQVGKRFASSVTPSGILARVYAKRFAGSITPTGGVVMTFIGRVFGYPGIVVASITKAGGLRARFRRG